MSCLFIVLELAAVSAVTVCYCDSVDAIDVM